MRELFEMVDRRRLLVSRLGMVIIPAAILMAMLIPLKFQAEAIIEHKIADFAPISPDREFDMTRLTSETQRNVTVLKSRYFTEQWMNRLSINSQTTPHYENKLLEFQNSLIVQPVNFSDLLVLKVRRPTPEEALQDENALIAVFSEWDADQMKEESREKAALLQSEIQSLENTLNLERSKLKRLKDIEVLSLSGLSGPKRIEEDLNANEIIYANLLSELEEANKEGQNENIHRIHMIAPPTVSSRPVRTRTALLIAALAISVLLLIGVALALETLESPSGAGRSLNGSVAHPPICDHTHV